MDDVNVYEQQRDRFLERLLRSARGTFETFTFYMGHRLGYYATLAGNEWTTIAELAEKTGTGYAGRHDQALRGRRGFLRGGNSADREFSFRFYRLKPACPVS
jgi:hypothetical protein